MAEIFPSNETLLSKNRFRNLLLSTALIFTTQTSCRAEVLPKDEPNNTILQIEQETLTEPPPFIPVGIISLSPDSDKFTCHLEVPAPVISIIEENGQFFIVGQATSNTTEMIFKVKNGDQIEIYRIRAQHIMLYFHDNQTKFPLHKEVFWNGGKDGKFKILLNDLPLDRIAREISARITIFTHLELPSGVVDCRSTSGILNQESENTGQRSPFSKIVDNPLFLN